MKIIYNDVSSFEKSYESKQLSNNIFDKKLNFMIVTKNEKNVLKNKESLNIFSHFLITFTSFVQKELTCWIWLSF